MDTDVSKEHASSIFKAKERHESLERTASPTRWYLSVRLHFGYFDLLRKKHLKPNEVVHIFKCSTYVCACVRAVHSVYQIQAARPCHCCSSRLHALEADSKRRFGSSVELRRLITD